MGRQSGRHSLVSSSASNSPERPQTQAPREAEGPWVVVEWEGSQAEACKAQAEEEGGKVGLKAPLLNKELGICLC